MMDYNKLIEQLRSTVSRSKRELLDNAAAAIETLMAELEALKEDVKCSSLCDSCKHNNCIPKCNLDCIACPHAGECPCVNCFDESCWEWRGQHREE